MYVGHVKAIQSGGLVEVWMYSKPNLKQKKHTRKRRNRQKRLIKSEYSGKQRKMWFERVVRANMDINGAPALLTLTMRDIEPLKDAWRKHSKFQMRLRYRHKNLKYITVPEFQKRGAVHFHVLIWGLSDTIVSDERKNRYIADIWEHGFVDIIQSDGRPGIIGYLAKYLSKTFQDERLTDERCYSVSRQCERPTRIKGKSLFAFAKDAWCIEGNVDSGLERIREYDTKWLGKCIYKRFKIF